MSFANALFRKSFLWRGLRLWLGARAIVGALLMISGHDPVRLSAASSLCMVVSMIVLSVADIHRRGERVLIGNMGIARVVAVGLLAAPTVAGEILVHFL